MQVLFLFLLLLVGLALDSDGAREVLRFDVTSVSEGLLLRLRSLTAY